MRTTKLNKSKNLVKAKVKDKKKTKAKVLYMCKENFKHSSSRKKHLD